MAVELKTLKEQLISNGYDEKKVNKSIAYLSDELGKVNNQVSKHSVAELYNLVVKYLNAGTNLDGINVVLVGKNMGLIQYFGYMNKIKQNHPDVFFDVQLVRGDDEFKVGKESGSVVYSHTIKDPFASYEDQPIKGAYCVIKFGSGNESIELLNERDYNEMKSKSRNTKTWNDWPSEFWRKSVVKRACKMYFAEEVEELEKIDNNDYGLDEIPTSEETKNKIIEANKEK